MFVEGWQEELQDYQRGNKMKKKSSKTVMPVMPSKKVQDDWEAQSWARTLMEAEKIKADKRQLNRALKAVKIQQIEAQKALQAASKLKKYK